MSTKFTLIIVYVPKSCRYYRLYPNMWAKNAWEAPWLRMCPPDSRRVLFDLIWPIPATRPLSCVSARLSHSMKRDRIGKVTSPRTSTIWKIAGSDLHRPAVGPRQRELWPI